MDLSSASLTCVWYNLILDKMKCILNLFSKKWVISWCVSKQGWFNNKSVCLYVLCNIFVLIIAFYFMVLHQAGEECDRQSPTKWGERIYTMRVLITKMTEDGFCDNNNNSNNQVPVYMYIGLPGGLSGKESACQCRRCRFDPWVGKIPWSRKWQPMPVFLLENPMDRGTWWATVHGVPNELDMT